MTAYAKAHGMPSIRVDGNDVLVVREAAQEMVERARQNEGPSLIVADTYRWREHCGPNFDNHIGYRTEEEYVTWKERDPITYMESSLMDRNILSKEDIGVMEKEIKISVGEAFEFAENSPFPAPGDAYQHLYK